MLPVAFADDSITSTASEQSQEQESTTDGESLPSSGLLAEDESQASKEIDEVEEAQATATPIPTEVPENTEDTEATPAPVPEEEEPAVSETTVPSSPMEVEAGAASEATKGPLFAAPKAIDESATIIGSGNCGRTATDTVTWTEYSDGNLTIAGNGQMKFFSSSNKPWSTEVTNITISEGVTNIGDFAFSGCTKLKNINIPNSVSIIGEFAFRNCTSLTSINLPEGLEEIRRYTFANCTNLLSVEIPDSVTEILDYAFSDCESLTNMVIPDSVTWIGYSAFSQCYNLESLQISNNMTSISSDAFFNCTSLASVIIPENVVKIESNAFTNCSNMTELTLPDGLTSIGASAFSGCRSLENVTIPDSVTSMEVDAFSGCTNLRNITISNSLTALENYVFEGCTSLVNVTIPDHITRIGEFSFANCTSLVNVFLPESITRIGISAFVRCSKLSNITFPDSVTSIDFNAFSECESLTNVTLPNNLKYIDDYVFSNCTNLTNITIPKSVTSIGDNAFKYCDNLSDVYFMGNESEWKAIDIGNNNSALETATIHYNYALLKEFHIVNTIPKQGESGVSITAYPNGTTAKYGVSPMVGLKIDIEFDQKISLGDGSIRVCDYNTGKIYREIKVAEQTIDSAEVSEDGKHLVIDLWNDLNGQWEEVYQKEITPLPYNTKMYVEIEKGAVVFQSDNIKFEGFSNRDVFNFTTEWGLTINKDWLSFINADAADTTEAGGYSAFYGFKNENHYELSDVVAGAVLTRCDTNGLFSDYYTIAKYIWEKTWNGSCNGMVSVMGLSSINKLNLSAWDSNAQNCYTLAWPQNSKEPFGVKDLINYYQVLQFLDDYPEHGNMFTKKQTVGEIIDLAKQFQESKIPLPIAIEFKGVDGKRIGHEILAYGFLEAENVYILNCYDPSVPYLSANLIVNKADYNDVQYYAGWKNGGYGWFEISKIEYTSLKDLDNYNIDDFAENSVKSPNSTKASMFMSRSKDLAKIYVGINNDFTLTNAEGETLQFQDGNFDGTMQVYDFTFEGEGTTAQYVLNVKPSESFKFQMETGETDVAVAQENSYLSMMVREADNTIVIQPGKAMSLSGKGTLNYSVMASVESEIADSVILSGTTEDTVALQYTDDGRIHLNGDNLEDVKVQPIKELQQIQEESASDNIGVVVSEPIPVRHITSIENEMSLSIGETKKLAVRILPENATNKAVTWASDDQSVAAVTEGGAVTAIGEGTATITVTTLDGGYKAFCSITVRKPEVTQVVITPSTDPTKLTQSYAGSSIDVTQLFEIDGNAGAATYTLLDGGTGTGSLTEDGNLTVTKAGTFVIQVDTAATDTHAAGSAQVTMTVNKGKGKGTLQVTGSTYPAGVQPAVQGNLSGGSVTYYYNTTDSNQGGSLWTIDTVLDAGEYWMYAEIAATDLYEAYTTSAVPFTVQQAVVDQLDLANLITAPVRGATPQTELTTSQFAGTILWSDTPTVFAPETVYTATVKLTAAQNYTLEGLKADSFQYAGAEVHYDPMANQLTIVFPATDGRQVQSFAVTGTPSKTTYDLGEAFDVTGLTMTVTYDDGTTETVTRGYRIEPATMAADTTQVVISYGGVKAEPVTGLTVRENLVSIQAPQAITGLANGTEKTREALGLPKTVKITTSRTQRAIAEADVTWDLDACSYDPAVKSEQTFVVQGLVSLPQGMTNLQNVPLTVAVEVTVKAAESKPTEPENPGDTEEKPGASNQPAGGNETPAPTASANAQSAADDTTKEEQNQSVTVPQTGDPTPITVLVVLMAVSLAGILALSTKRKKGR